MLVAQKKISVAEEDDSFGKVVFDSNDELRSLISQLEAAANADEKIKIAELIVKKFADSPIAQFALENAAENSDAQVCSAIKAML
jgi:hypothetical protein